MGSIDASILKTREQIENTTNVNDLLLIVDKIKEAQVKINNKKGISNEEQAKLSSSLQELMSLAMAHIARLKESKITDSQSADRLYKGIMDVLDKINNRIMQSNEIEIYKLRNSLDYLEDTIQKSEIKNNIPTSEYYHLLSLIDETRKKIKSRIILYEDGDQLFQK